MIKTVELTGLLPETKKNLESFEGNMPMILRPDQSAWHIIPVGVYGTDSKKALKDIADLLNKYSQDIKGSLGKAQVAVFECTDSNLAYVIYVYFTDDFIKKNKLTAIGNPGVFSEGT